MTAVGHLERIVIRNFRSIGACDVRLGRLSYVVGRNGSGKSNFLDALHFVRDALSGSLERALHERGGIEEVRRRSTGHPHRFAIRLELRLADGRRAVYALEVGARDGGGHEVVSEMCAIDGDTPDDFYEIAEGRVVRHGAFPFPAIASDRLALVALSGLTAFRPVFDALTGSGFYNLDPRVMRELQPPQDGRLLGPSGENIASVIGRLQDNAPEAVEILTDYLRRIVPAIQSVSRERLGHRETLEFRQRVVGAEYPWRFPAQNMSDGTLRALGVLTALFQGDADDRPTLIGIEEPETSLHPAAGAALREAFGLASESVQVVVTSHSPDLLDDPDLPEAALLAVTSVDGETRVGRIDGPSRDALRRHLFTAGELLRLDRLAPDPGAAGADLARQADLFGRHDAPDA